MTRLVKKYLKLKLKENKELYYHNIIDDYLELEENKEAFCVYKEITQDNFKKVYIYGAQQTGKSHLSAAICEKLNAQNIPIYHGKREAFMYSGDRLFELLNYWEKRNAGKINTGEQEDGSDRILLKDWCIIDDLQLYPMSNSFATKWLGKMLKRYDRVIVLSSLPIHNTPETSRVLFDDFTVINLEPLGTESKKKVLISFAEQYQINPLFPEVRDALIELSEYGLSIGDMKEILLASKKYSEFHHCRMKSRNLHLFLKKYNLDKETIQIMQRRCEKRVPNPILINRITD